MNIEYKMLLFYLSLDDYEKKKFKSIVGPIAFDKISSSNTYNEIKNNITEVTISHKTNSMDYDTAIIQMVRYIVSNSPSNVDLANSITNITKSNISRPEKRSKYELQGLLLGALLDAPKDILVKFRNQLAHNKLLTKNDSDTNLDKWFSIILGDKNGSTNN